MEADRFDRAIESIGQRLRQVFLIHPKWREIGDFGNDRLDMDESGQLQSHLVDVTRPVYRTQGRRR